MATSRMKETHYSAYVDKIRAITFREARDARAGFISRKWVASRINRSEDFVKRNWHKDPYNCEREEVEPGYGTALSQESKDVISQSLAGRKRKSINELVREIEAKRQQKKSRLSVYRKVVKQDFKAFHVIKKPLKTDLNKQDRLWFCEFLSNWKETDFLHLACSDKFFIWTMRGPNKQNDRIWARSLDEIEDKDRYRQVVKHPDCVGLFVISSARRMAWVIKEQGES